MVRPLRHAIGPRSSCVSSVGGVGSGVALASMVVDLMADGAAVGRQVVAQAKPPLTRQAYLDFQRRMSRRETYDGSS